MGIFRPTLNTTMCHIRTQNGTNLEENTLAFKWAGSAPTDANLLALATALRDTVALGIRAFTSDRWLFNQIYCRNIDTEVANEATYIYAPNVTGQRGGAPLAASEACGIVKRTGRTGRGQHGRMSCSGFVEGDCDGNSVGSSLIALLSNVALQMLTSYLAGQFKPSLAHIPRPGGPSPGTSDLITETIILDSNVDSQKTRLNSHGR
jgi:hypothetical protein